MTAQSQIINKIGDKTGIDGVLMGQIKIQAVECSNDLVTVQFERDGKIYGADFTYKAVCNALDEKEIICADRNKHGFIYYQERDNELGLTDTYVRLVNRVIPPFTANVYQKSEFNYKPSWVRCYTLKDAIKANIEYIIEYCEKDEDYKLMISEGALWDQEEIHHINYVHPRRPILTTAQMWQLGMI